MFIQKFIRIFNGFYLNFAMFYFDYFNTYFSTFTKSHKYGSKIIWNNIRVIYQNLIVMLGQEISNGSKLSVDLTHTIDRNICLPYNNQLHHCTEFHPMGTIRVKEVILGDHYYYISVYKCRKHDKNGIKTIRYSNSNSNYRPIQCKYTCYFLRYFQFIMQQFIICKYFKVYGVYGCKKEFDRFWPQRLIVIIRIIIIWGIF